MEGKDGLERETKLPEGITKTLFFGPLSSGAFLLRPREQVDVLFEDAFFTLAPKRGTLVLAIDFRLVPQLASLLGGGMIVRGVLVLASSSSLMNSLLGICWYFLTHTEIIHKRTELPL